jgi:hypothetical protein
MTEDKLRDDPGLKKQGAILLRSSNKRYMLGTSTKLPNLTVTIPIRIMVRTAEYQNPKSYIPQYYQGPDNNRKHTEFCVENFVHSNPQGVIILRQDKIYASQCL